MVEKILEYDSGSPSCGNLSSTKTVLPASGLVGLEVRALFEAWNGSREVLKRL